MDEISHSWSNWIQRWQTRSSILPHPCIICHHYPTPDISHICAHCDSLLPHIGQACRQCALPLVSERAQLCGACIKHPPHFDYALAPFHYAPPISQLIQRYKFKADLRLVDFFAAQLAQHIKHTQKTTLQPLPELLIPVPLHPEKHRQRGFNQAERLTQALSAQLNIPYQHEILKKTRKTQPQSGLKQAERRKNLKNAFELIQPLEAKHIALIDDVITTGSTGNEIAHTLKRNNSHKRKKSAEAVSIYAIARVYSATLSL